MTELKPCPFCGSWDIGVIKPTDNRTGPCVMDWLIQCYDCSVETCEYVTEAEAIAAWNARTQPAGLVEAIHGVDALAIGSNDRGGSKITLDFEQPEAAYKAFTIISDAYNASSDSPVVGEDAELEGLTATSKLPSTDTADRRELAIQAIAQIEMDREGYPLSRTQQEIYDDAAEMFDAVLAAIAK